MSTTHSYEDGDGVIHMCGKGECNFYNNPITLVYTACGIDVPANKSFESKERPTCKKCLEIERREGEQ